MNNWPLQELQWFQPRTKMLSWNHADKNTIFKPQRANRGPKNMIQNWLTRLDQKLPEIIAPIDFWWFCQSGREGGYRDTTTLVRISYSPIYVVVIFKIKNPFCANDSTQSCRVWGFFLLCCFSHFTSSMQSSLDLRWTISSLTARWHHIWWLKARKD